MSAIRTVFGNLARQQKSIIKSSARQMATTMDLTINITFVDNEGNRATVPGRIGHSLLDVARLHKIDLEGPCQGGGAPMYVKRTENWVEHQFGEGPQCGFCMVKIPSTFNHLFLEKFHNEEEILQDCWKDEYSPATSRMACLITLEKKHDGLVVFVPDAQPVDII